MIEYIALLTTSTLFGGMLLYSFGFASILFHALPSEEASRVIRLAFPWYYLFIIVVSAVNCLLLVPYNSPAFLIDAQSAALLGSVTLFGIFSRQILMPRINLARDLQLQGDTIARKRFGRLHGLAVVINFVQIAILGYVLTSFL